MLLQKRRWGFFGFDNLHPTDTRQLPTRINDACVGLGLLILRYSNYLNQYVVAGTASQNRVDRVRDKDQLFAIENLCLNTVGHLFIDLRRIVFE